jgi:hypothetical protein
MSDKPRKARGAFGGPITERELVFARRWGCPDCQSGHALRVTGTVHSLKTWPTMFEAILDGSKRFELRRNDRGFRVGDRLHLREWRPRNYGHDGDYTGRSIDCLVTFILNGGGWGIEDDYVVMGVAFRPRLSAASDDDPAPPPFPVPSPDRSGAS